VHAECVHVLSLIIFSGWIGGSQDPQDPLGYAPAKSPSFVAANQLNQVVTLTRVTNERVV